MAWSFTDLKYGWKIAAGISLAAATIFVVNNERERVNQADIIELALGTTERCLATQYATNPATYYVAPPSFVRSWYSNSYVTTNVPGDPVTNWTAQLWTNTFTNVIGWRTDRAMMVELDAKIKALVPYYTDTNTVYAGTTNFAMWTVASLFSNLNIGNKADQFTSVPAIGTNEATYGALPWRIYKEDLEERYKVLNAMKMTTLGLCAGTNWVDRSIDIWGSSSNTVFSGGGTISLDGDNLGWATSGVFYTSFDHVGTNPPSVDTWISFSGPASPVGLYEIAYFSRFRGFYFSASLTVHDPKIQIWNAYPTYLVGWTNIYTETNISSAAFAVGGAQGGLIFGTPHRMAAYGIAGTITPTFQYCTNKYW